MSLQLGFTNEFQEIIDGVIRFYNRELITYEEQLAKLINRSQINPLYWKTNIGFLVWTNVLTKSIKFLKLMRLLVQSLQKMNKPLISMVKERYANALVDVMFDFDDGVKKGVIPEDTYIAFCNDVGKILTNDLYKVVDDTLNRDFNTLDKIIRINTADGYINVPIPPNLGEQATAEFIDRIRRELQAVEQEQVQVPEPVQEPVQESVEHEDVE